MPPDLAALRLMFNDLEKTVSTQIATGEKIDEKAARIIGWNGLLLGLLVTAASISSGPARGGPFWLGLLALCSLLASVWFAVKTYMETEYRMGLEPADVAQALTFDIAEDFHLQKAIEGYRGAYDDNRDSIDRSSRSFRSALFAFFAALLLATASTALFLSSGGTS